MLGRRLLVLAPHTDDAELGCGGAIARFIEEGVEVYVAAFSTAESSLPVGAEPTMLRDEFLDSMDIMGVSSEHRTIYDYPVRRLSDYRQEVLDDMIALRRSIDPTAVLGPSGSDLHQDHQVIHAEGARAFKDMTYWGYELPWNHITFCANGFVTIDAHHLEKKWRALQAYRSQIELRRPYFSADFLTGLARLRGVQVKADFAEAFDVSRVRL
ncbi:MAG: PIG-L family deacetylase [Armatimonadetes bacterium]|nr:PIG-L family deacetylase [Armatimonadota bacterium]